MQKKGGAEAPPQYLLTLLLFLHQVSDCDQAIVDVTIVDRCADRTISSRCGERIGDHAVAGLKSDLGLEGVLANRTHHLERHVRAVE